MIPTNELSRLALFQNTEPCVIAALAKRGTVVSFPAGAVVFLTGSAPRGWYILLEGFVRVVRGGESRQHVIHTEGPGGTLGEVPLFSGDAHPATCIANEPTRCALFDRLSLESAIAECPKIAFLLNRRLALRVRDLVARLDDRSSKSVRSRLAQFLIERASIAPEKIASVGMTQQNLAEELGTSREVVSRELRKLADERLIQLLSGGRFRVVDAEALRGV